MSRKPPTLNQFLRQEVLFEIDGKEVKMTREKYFEIKGRKPDGVLPEERQHLFRIYNEIGPPQVERFCSNCQGEFDDLHNTGVCMKCFYETN